MKINKKKLSYYFNLINHDKNAECELMIHILIQILTSNSKEAIDYQINQHNIDWSHFIESISKQGIILPVGHVLKFYKIKNIPINISNQLNKVQRYYAQKNRNLFTESIRIFNIFKKNNLQAIPYKGLPFAKQFYGNIFQRTSVDIDFALDIKDFQKAKEIMLSLGYEEFKSNINHDLIEESRAYYLDYPFVKRNKEGKIIFNVEFHWTPSHQILNIPVSFKDFEDQTVELQIGNTSITTFNKVHQAFFAVIHHGNVDCWGKLKHLVDFAKIMQTLNEEEKIELEKLCKKYKIFKSLQIGKGLLGAIFDDEIYKHIKVSNRWKSDLLDGKLVGKWSDNKMKFWYFVSSRDSFMDKIKATISITKYQLFIKSKFS